MESRTVLEHRPPIPLRKRLNPVIQSREQRGPCLWVLSHYWVPLHVSVSWSGSCPCGQWVVHGAGKEWMRSFDILFCPEKVISTAPHRPHISIWVLLIVDLLLVDWMDILDVRIPFSSRVFMLIYSISIKFSHSTLFLSSASLLQLVLCILPSFSFPFQKKKEELKKKGINCPCLISSSSLYLFKSLAKYCLFNSRCSAPESFIQSNASSKSGLCSCKNSFVIEWHGVVSNRQPFHFHSLNLLYVLHKTAFAKTWS